MMTIISKTNRDVEMLPKIVDIHTKDTPTRLVPLADFYKLTSLKLSDAACKL